MDDDDMAVGYGLGSGATCTLRIPPRHSPCCPRRRFLTGTCVAGPIMAGLVLDRITYDSDDRAVEHVGFFSFSFSSHQHKRWWRCLVDETGCHTTFGVVFDSVKTGVQTVIIFFTSFHTGGNDDNDDNCQGREAKR